MNSSLKTFGLALALTFSLLALAASSASAFEFFEGHENTAAFRGEQTESVEFKLGTTATIVCTGGVLRGMFVPEVEKKTKTITTSDGTAGVGVAYTGCMYQAESSTFKSNHCNYTFHAEKETLSIVKNGTATEESECEKTGMTFTSAKCTVTIKPEAKNQGLAKINPIYARNKEGLESEWFFNLKPSFKKIKYSTSKGCLGGEATPENGEYLRGESAVKGFTGTEFNTRATLTLVP